MQQRAEGAVDQSGLLVEREISHIFFAQIEFYARSGSSVAGLLEHCARGIDTDDLPPRSLGNWDGDSPVPDRKLNDWTISLACKGYVEGNVRLHMSRPLVVAS